MKYKQVLIALTAMLLVFSAILLSGCTTGEIDIDREESNQVILEVEVVSEVFELGENIKITLTLDNRMDKNFDFECSDTGPVYDLTITNENDNIVFVEPKYDTGAGEAITPHSYEPGKTTLLEVTWNQTVDLYWTDSFAENENEGDQVGPGNYWIEAELDAMVEGSIELVVKNAEIRLEVPIG
jgi:hypothetical protein